MVWNKKSIAGSKPCIPKEVPARRYLKVIANSIPPQWAVRNWSVPPTQWIDNIKIEITTKEAILGQVSLSVAHESVVINWSKNPYMWTVHSPNALVKEFESRIPQNLLWYWCVQHWEVHLGTVEFWGGKEVYELLEISTNTNKSSRWSDKIGLPCDGVHWTLELLSNKARRESSDAGVEEYPQLLFNSYTILRFQDTILFKDMHEHREYVKGHTKIYLGVLGVSCQQF